MRLSALCLKDFPLNIGGKSIGLACTDKKLSFLIIMASMIPLSTLNVTSVYNCLLAGKYISLIHVFIVYIIINRNAVIFTSTLYVSVPNHCFT